MIDEMTWKHLSSWASRYSDREVSDAARRWSFEERKRVERPQNDGEWEASMEAAFDAGFALAEILQAQKR